MKESKGMLTHEERCAMVALYLRDVPTAIIAKAYGVSTRYVYELAKGQITSVAVEMRRLGAPGMIDTYLRPSAEAMIARVDRDGKWDKGRKCWVR